MMQADGGQNPRRIRKILTIAEGPDAAENLVAAEDLAARHGAALGVFACVEPPSDLERLSRSTGQSPKDLLDRMVAEQRRALVDLVDRAGLAGVAEIYVAVGKPFFEISRHVAAHRTDLVVKTAERLTGAGRFLFASTDQHLVRKCPCAVWLRLPEAPRHLKTILAAVDVDEWDAREPETLAALNRQILDVAVEIAGPQAVIHVLHAWDAPGEGMVWTFSSGADSRVVAQSYVNDVQSAHAAALERLMAPFMARAAQRGGPKLLPRLAKGSVRAVIAERAKALGADILVMGTVARTGVGGILIGNTAEDILNTVECSVMTVKPEGFVSPLDLRG